MAEALNPEVGEVNAWTDQLVPGQLHDDIWIAVNRRFHGIALGARNYANEHLTSDPVRRQAFFDGLTFGLGALVRHEEIAGLEAILAVGNSEAEASVTTADL